MEVRSDLARALIEAHYCRRQARKVPGYEFERSVYVTPFPGASGLAGWVVTIDDSPPRMVALVLRYKADGIDGPEVLMVRPRVQTIGYGSSQRLRALWRAILAVVEAARGEMVLIDGHHRVDYTMQEPVILASSARGYLG